MRVGTGVLGAAALLGGLALSLLGMGLLWAGAGWGWQLLVGLPFLGLGYGVARAGGRDEAVSLLVIVGAAPLGMMVMMFRDRDDSHLLPVLTVLSWLAGAVAGKVWAHCHGGVRPDQGAG